MRQRKSGWLVWLEVIPLALIGPFIVCAPLAWGLWISGISGRVLYWLLPHYRHIARRNLRIAFGDEWSETQVRSCIQAAWANAVKTFFEFLRLGVMSRKQLLSLTLPIEGYPDYLAAAASGRGVIAVACHLGNWYWPVFRAAAEGHAVHVIVRPLDNPVLDQLMNHIFNRWNIRVIPRGQTAWASLAALRKGETLAVMVDLNAQSDGCFVPFFGVPASTLRGVARLRQGTSAEVLIVGSPRAIGDHHPININWLRDPPMADELLLATIHQHFEVLIRAHPGDYFWIQARWRKRPPGEPDLYAES